MERCVKNHKWTSGEGSLGSNGADNGLFWAILWGMELHDLPKFAPQGYLFLLSWSLRYADLSSYRSRRQLEVWVASRLIETLLGDNHVFGA